jgi:ABC-type spermidine/putrescine transport system permease subunit II
MTKKTVKPDMYALSTIIIITVFTLLIISNIKGANKANPKAKKRGGKS